MTNHIPESGRIDPADHNDPRWRIHEIVHDFELIDAWKLPVNGSYDEFPELPKLFMSLDLADDDIASRSASARARGVE